MKTISSIPIKNTAVILPQDTDDSKKIRTEAVDIQINDIEAQPVSETLPPYQVALNTLVQNTEKKYQITIDDISKGSLSRAFKVGNVTDISNLELIAPGPLFYSWMPLHGTAIFNGKNNKKKIDYTQLLIDKANQFAQWEIPVLIIYSTNNMIESEKKEMSRWTGLHENILMVHIEEHLTNWTYYQYYLAQYKIFSLQCSRYYRSKYLDDIRFMIINSWVEVLTIAELLAISRNKHAWVQKLQRLGHHSIMCSDIDNTFLQKPMFQLSIKGCKPGYTFFPYFLDYVGLQTQRNWARYERYADNFKVVLSYNKSCLHMSNDREYLKQQPRKLVKYFMDGEFFQDLPYIFFHLQDRSTK